MGGALFIEDKFRRNVGIELGYIGREYAASPAPGSKKMDRHQQEQVISRAIAPKPQSGAGSPPGKAVAASR
jgi:2-oxoglutarate dehydrogenase complex dehydrogenase (E1) component-like enzyme